MNVIFILIAVSLLVAIGFLVSFIWSIRAGQYEDEYTPSVRILFDDETNVMPEEEKSAVGSRQSAVSSQQSAVQEPGTNTQEPIPKNQ